MATPPATRLQADSTSASRPATRPQAQSTIASVATALPPHILAQPEAKTIARNHFASAYGDIERLLPAYDHAHIQQRHLVRPVSWYLAPHSFAETTEVYQQEALALSIEAAAAALTKSGLQATDIGSIVFVSSTGVATPSLDAHVVAALGMRRDVFRVPVWGLGCAGGVAGARLASALVGQGPGARAVLLVVVETCSLTFQREDRSKSNFIAVGLFGDGAAAAVFVPPQGGCTVAGSRSHLFPDSAAVMGWRVTDSGLAVRFSRDIPRLVRNELPHLTDAALAEWSLSREQLQHFVAHPGGAKVLDAYRDALAVPDTELAHARAVLRECGNMSAPSVLFVLERTLRMPAGDAWGLMTALGPGFSCEQLLFRW